jgi:hypothetical protein
LTSIAAILSAAAALAAVVHAATTFRRNAELQAFLVLTGRYEDIMEAFPVSARTLDEWPSGTDADLSLRLRYLNLCSEEFYLHRRGLLSDRVWKIWEAEMRATLASPAYIEAWAALASRFDSYPEFTSFVFSTQGADQPLPASGRFRDRWLHPS